jgi:hypothetical protein
MIFVGCPVCAQLAAASGRPSFARMATRPTLEAEIARVEAVIDQINAQPLEFVVQSRHGAGGGLHREWLLARKAQFARIRHPFYPVPGDNEWKDCKDPLAAPAALAGDLLRERPRAMRAPALGKPRLGVRPRSTFPVMTTTCGTPSTAARMESRASFLPTPRHAAAAKNGLMVFMQANPFFPFRDGFAS